MAAEEKPLSNNLIEYFNPTLTWSRRLFNGNLQKMVAASSSAFEAFQKKKGTPDLIHAQVAFPAGYVARELSKKYNVPYLITEHMGPFPLPALRWKMDAFVLAPLREAHGVLAVSERLKHSLSQYGIKAQVVPNGIDEDLFKPQSKEKSALFRFVYVGRLEKEKGCLALLAACRQLRTLYFELLMIGDGSLKTQLNNSILREGLSQKVKLLGPMAPLQVAEKLQSADAFVFPSEHESFGIAPLEALACGVPLLATDVGEVGKMIQATTGRILPSTMPQPLAAAMLEMMQSAGNFSSKTIRDFYLKHYSSNIAVEKLRSAYLALVKTYNAPSNVY